jgi:hypothetical protein
MENINNLNLDLLKHRVSKWEEFNGFRIFSAYNYAPFNSGALSQEYLKVRLLVWHFKNDSPHITEQMHNEALDSVVILLSEILKRTFGELLNNLTLVCIPASNKETHIKRYEEFSTRICSSLGMQNAFPYISILKDKTPKHLGGNESIDMSYSFDKDYFVNKNIILFDDIMTSGNSFTKFAKKLTSCQSNVIAAISIGQTYPPNQRPHLIHEFRDGHFDCE